MVTYEVYHTDNIIFLLHELSGSENKLKSNRFLLAKSMHKDCQKQKTHVHTLIRTNECQRI
jgi:hypothetical protein